MVLRFLLLSVRFCAFLCTPTPPSCSPGLINSLIFCHSKGSSSDVQRYHSINSSKQTSSAVLFMLTHAVSIIVLEKTLDLQDEAARRRQGGQPKTTSAKVNETKHEEFINEQKRTPCSSHAFLLSFVVVVRVLTMAGTSQMYG